jgi:hypothetical protein
MDDYYQLLQQLLQRSQAMVTSSSQTGPGVAPFPANSSSTTQQTQGGESPAPAPQLPLQHLTQPAAAATAATSSLSHFMQVWQDLAQQSQQQQTQSQQLLSILLQRHIQSLSSQLPQAQASSSASTSAVDIIRSLGAAGVAAALPDAVAAAAALVPSGSPLPSDLLCLLLANQQQHQSQQQRQNLVEQILIAQLLQMLQQQLLQPPPPPQPQQQLSLLLQHGQNQMAFEPLQQHQQGQLISQTIQELRQQEYPTNSAVAAAAQTANESDPKPGNPVHAVQTSRNQEMRAADSPHLAEAAAATITKTTAPVETPAAVPQFKCPPVASLTLPIHEREQQQTISEDNQTSNNNKNNNNNHSSSGAASASDTVPVFLSESGAASIVEVKVRKRRHYNSESFPQKLHRLVHECTDAGKGPIVGWLADGTGFEIRNMTDFVKEIIPQYFRHRKLTSFRRQLSMYGFRRDVTMRESSCYAHELFHRDHPEKCKEIKRLTEFELVLRNQQQKKKSKKSTSASASSASSVEDSTS